VGALLQKAHAKHLFYFPHVLRPRLARAPLYVKYARYRSHLQRLLGRVLTAKLLSYRTRPLEVLAVEFAVTVLEKSPAELFEVAKNAPTVRLVSAASEQNVSSSAADVGGTPANSANCATAPREETAD